MKSVLKLFFISLVFFSCDNNESLVEEDPIILTIKETTNHIGNSANDGTVQYKLYYHDNGQPKFLEEYEPNSTTTIWAQHEIFYNADNTLDSIYVNTFEPTNIKYRYENNKLNYLKDSGYGSSRRYNITYSNNTIVATKIQNYSTDNNEERIYTFSNENYDLLLQAKTTTSPVDPDINPYMTIIDFEYDSNSNLITRTRKDYSDATQDEYVVRHIVNLTYDNKHNPYKNTIISTPVIKHNLVSVPSFIMQDDKISSNNIISRTSYWPASSLLATTDYEYIYNEFNYPISLIETTTYTNSSGEDESNVTTKTFIYY